MSNKTKTLKGKTPSRRKFMKAAAATGVAAVAASSPFAAAPRIFPQPAAAPSKDLCPTNQRVPQQWNQMCRRSCS